MLRGRRKVRDHEGEEDPQENPPHTFQVMEVVGCQWWIRTLLFLFGQLQSEFYW